MEMKEGTAYELVQGLQELVLKNKVPEVSVLVEDENGRCEYITNIWYDEIRGMIRMTVGGVEFTDATDT